MNFVLINVGIGELTVSKSPDILRTILGSCVGICLYEPVSKIGGLSHIMLPEFTKKNSSKKKYADTAIPMMIDEMCSFGADRGKIVAKIIGGSNMFKMGKYVLIGEIGTRNSDKVLDILSKLNINIVSEDIGGDYGRTIDFYLDTGNIKIKTMNLNEKII